MHSAFDKLSIRIIKFRRSDLI